VIPLFFISSPKCLWFHLAVCCFSDEWW